MSVSKPLRCKKCGKLIGYVAVTAKSALDAKPDLENAQIVGTCVDCASGVGFYRRNF